MKKANADIRNLLKENDVSLWQIGAALGVSEGTIIRWLRFELDTEKKDQIKRIINDFTKEAN